MNLLRAVVQSADPSGLVVAFNGASLQTLVFSPALKQGDVVTVGIRPEHISRAPGGTLAAAVQAVEHLGGETHLHLLLSSDETLTIRVSGESTVVPEEKVHFQFAPAVTHVFDRDGEASPRLATTFKGREGA